MNTTGSATQIHASAVAVGGKGCLILGASGTGKSTLCFELMALGGVLIADDRVDLKTCGGQLMLSGPEVLHGRIEAYGLGILQVPSVQHSTPCGLIVDLDHGAERLPRLRSRDLLGISCPVILGKDRAGLASIVHVLLRHGQWLDPESGVNQ